MKKFKCFRCGEEFDEYYKLRVDDNLCKYCETLKTIDNMLKDKE